MGVCQCVVLHYLHMWMMEMAAFIGEICSDVFNSTVVLNFRVI